MHRYRIKNSLIAFALLALVNTAYAGTIAENPCAAKNKTDQQQMSRPPGTKLASGKLDELRREGEQLWNSKSLSSNGLACVSCHQNHAAFNASFAKPYPHLVTMVKERTKMKKIALDEMIQFCMVNPMAAKPLAWDSRELAALTAYTREVQKRFKPELSRTVPITNPCAPANPCAPRKE